MAFGGPLFSDLAKCRQHFLASSGGGGQNFNVAKADEFCQKNMSPMDFCVGKSLLKAMAENSLSTDQLPAYRAKFANECQASANAAQAAQSSLATQLGVSQQITADQIAAAQAAAAAKKAEEDAKKNQGKSDKGGGDGPGLKDIAGIAKDLIGKDGLKDLAQGAKDLVKGQSIFGESFGVTIDNSIKNAGEAKADTDKTAPTGGSTQDPSLAAIEKENREGIAEMERQDAADEARERSPASGADDKPTAADRDDAAAGQTSQTDPGATETDPAKYEADTKAAKADLEQDKAEIGKHSPEAKAAVDDMAGKADGAGAEIKPSEKISGAAKKTSAELNQKVQQTSSSAQGELSQGGFSLPFSKTSQEIQKAQKEIKAYTDEVKEKCTQSAEKADTLCKEKTSPGRISTNGFMEVMGGILGSIGSAQEALAATSKTADAAKKGLTVAKLSCQAAQASCNGLCQAAIADLEKKKSTAEQQIQSSLQSDEQASEQICQSYDQSAQACMSCECCDPSQYIQAAQSCRQENQKKKQAGEKAKKEIAEAVQKEQTPEEGTSPGLAKMCATDIQKEVTQLAKQIGELLKKKMEADKGEKQLNNGGVAGAAPIKIEEYCESKTGRDTEFCKCKKDNTKQGCPGFVASTEILKQQDAFGTNLKGSGGVSNFAGIMQQGKPSGINLNSANNNGNNGDRSANGDLKLPDASGFSSAKSANAAGGNGGSRNSFGSNKGDVAKPKYDNKKWSFGSFVNALTGGSSGSRGSKAPSANGALKGGSSGSGGNSKQEAGIKRRLASDKLSSEVTNASGKSNWEKIRQAYLIKENTLLSGQ